MNEMYQPVDFSGQSAEPVGRYAAKTFGWMGLGLLITFAVMLASYFTGAIYYVFEIPSAYLVLGIAEIAVVLFLSARIQKLSVGAARALFFTYAALNGIVFGAYFIIFEATSLIFVFAMTAVYFGVMAGVGYFTKVDLSSLRPVLLGGLVFMLLFWVASELLHFTGFDRVMCMIGVALFLALTAYDTQKIKHYHEVYSASPEMLAKASIFSALQLYLDFINLFLYLLRFLGRRK